MENYMRKSLYTALLCSVAAVAAETPEQQIKTIGTRLDSVPEYVGSTALGRDASPVSFSGDFDLRVKHFDYYKWSALQMNDRMRTLVDGVLDLSLGVSPSSSVSMWTTLGMPFDMSGYYSNNSAYQANNLNPNTAERVSYAHHSDYYGVSLFEQMTAGIALRGPGFSGRFRAGGTLWANSSPLTIWERETSQRFASQFETFEDEKTVSTYYKEKSFKPVKEGGRAFWTNRSFGGLMLELLDLPGDFMAQAILSQPADMDAGTRDGLRMLGSQPGELEMRGEMELRGAVYHGRIAKQNLFNNVTLGANYVGVMFDRDLVYEGEYSTGPFLLNGIDPYLVNNHVASLDLKGDVAPNLFVMMDVAVSRDDTTKFVRGPENTVGRSGIWYEEDLYTTSKSDPAVGVYTKVQSKHWEPITLEGIYLPKDFFSPYGMTDNSRFRSWRKDEFYLGAGTFRYGSNLLGVNLKLEPQFNRGRFDVQYGQHKQLEAGQDVILFKYNLNGRAMWESTNSWTKNKPLLQLDSGNANDNARYVSRAAVLQNSSTTKKMYRQEGGLWGGTWELWESFTPYDNVGQLADSVVPSHEKWSSVLTIDAGYDIGHWFNTDRNIMISAYTALMGVSTSMQALPLSESQSDMLLWSCFFQSEPTIALTPTLHALGIFGFETWRAERAYVQRTAAALATTSDPSYNLTGGKSGGIYYEFAPINYLQTALGFGFDWDFAPRAGLHVRYKWATHTDETVSENDWKAHIVQAETKVWF